MNSSIDITTTFQMVAFEPNYTYADLQTELDGVLKSANFSSLLSNINANIADQSFSTTVLSQATTTSTVATGTVAASSIGTGAVASTTATAAATNTQKSAAGKSASCWIGSWSFVFCAILITMVS
jgi:hypothetical protein